MRHAAIVSAGLAIAVALAASAPEPVASAPPAPDSADRWCVRAPTRPSPPQVRDASWCTNEIDRFILARLESAGLHPAPAAEKPALIRRASFDLTGLPPTPDEVSAFVADSSADAYSRLIDRLLASPQYGVRWGRHWLDLVRWAETDGYERDRVKPGAWRYRDWVVDAFNDDLPYDEFLLQQLAGDELANESLETFAATGYLHLGVRDDEPTDPELAIFDDLDGMLDTTCRAMLGVSMGCVRCHDHKRDPISHAEYYGMLAYFRGLEPYRGGGGNSIAPEHFVRRVVLDSPERAAQLAQYGARRDALRSEVNAIVQLSLGSAGAAPSPSPDEFFGQPTEALSSHLAFEGDPELCEPGVRGHALLVRNAKDARTVAPPAGDDFTISCFIRPGADGPGEPEGRWFLGAGIVDGEVPGITDDFGISWSVGQRVCAGTGNPETFIASPTGISLGLWHHVAFTRVRATGEIALWVDGERVAHAKGGTQRLAQAASTSQPPAPASALTVGLMHTGANPFPGAIDEVRVYELVLADAEILALAEGAAYGLSASHQVADQLGKAQFDRLTELRDERLALRAPEIEVAQVLSAIERTSSIPATHRLERGSPHSPAEEVTPAILAWLGGGAPAIVPPVDGQSSGRRLALARWIVHPRNPRTARVIVNRLWQHHFGRGICRSSNDFGMLGEAPTHPELLDWLACELVDRQWSLKSMHRLIMHSSAYRMAWRADDPSERADSMNDLFWKFDMRRLSAEEIRDAVLHANGSINLQLGGESVYPPIPAEVLATASRPEEAWGKASDEQAARRSLYIFTKRSLLDPMLSAHDMADTDSSCPVRFMTIVPTQALTMVNGEFAHREAARFAARLRQEEGEDAARCVRRGIELALSRPAQPREITEGMTFLDALQREDGLAADEALASYCLALYNLNEFVFID